MKKLLLVTIFLTISLTLTACSRTNENSTDLLQKCPEQKIINRMPQIVDESQANIEFVNEYYILDGERKEISDFDSEWLEKNCEIEVVEAF